MYEEKFYIVAGNNEKYQFFGDFGFDKDAEDCMGTGTLAMPYHPQLWAFWEPGFTELTVYGGTYDEERLFHGRTRGIKQSGETIEISLQDDGWRLKQICPDAYKDITDVATAFVKFVESAGMVPVVLLTQNYQREEDDTASTSTTGTGEGGTSSSSSSGTGEGGTTPAKSPDYNSSTSGPSAVGAGSGGGGGGAISMFGILGGLMSSTANAINAALANAKKSTPTTVSAATTTKTTTSTSNTGTTDTTTCVCSKDAHGDCGYCGWETSGEHCFENKCPFESCGGVGTLKFPGKPGFPNQITCTKCGADFCGKCGNELSGPPKAKLSPCTSGAGTEEEEEKPGTYEDEIKKMCEYNDLIFYTNQYNECVLIDYKGLMADIETHAFEIKNEYIEYPSFDIDVSQFGYANTVIVKYANGQVKESYEDLVKIFGEIPKIYEEPTLDQSAAKKLALNKLATLLRDFSMEVRLTVLHSGKIEPGSFAKVTNPITQNMEIYYVSGVNVSHSPDGTLKSSLTLLYAPKNPDATSIPEVAGPTNIGDTITQIGRDASRFKFVLGSCSTAACMEKKGSGDCWAMSDYLYNRLTSAGIRAKIVQYKTSMSNNHESVLYYKGGSWIDFPYSESGIARGFRSTSGSRSGTTIRGG